MIKDINCKYIKYKLKYLQLKYLQLNMKYSNKTKVIIITVPHIVCDDEEEDICDQTSGLYARKLKDILEMLKTPKTSKTPKTPKTPKIYINIYLLVIVIGLLLI